MVGNLETFGPGHTVLAFFDLGIKKFFNAAAVQAHKMVMMLPFVELVDGFAALKMAAAQNAGLLELRQHPVDRCQAHVRPVKQQHAKYVLCGHVALAALLEYLQNLEARQGCLETGIFQLVDSVHAIPRQSAAICHPQGSRYNGPMISPYCIRPNVSRCARAAGAVLLALGLAACGTANDMSNRVASIVSPYKMDIVQGNFVSKEQAAALRPGMSRLQVRDILGTPLLVSMFHADRWDYIFTFRRQGVEPQSRRVTVFFKSDVLDRFEAGDLPTEAEFVASLDSGRRSGKAPVLEASEESLAKFAAAKPAATASQPKTLPPLPESYPPLEAPSR